MPAAGGACGIVLVLYVARVCFLLWCVHIAFILYCKRFVVIKAVIVPSL